MKMTKRTLLVSAASLLLVSGCAKPAAYKDPIVNFQMASTVVIEGARTEYAVVNKKQRDAIIDRHVAEKKKITLPDINTTRLLDCNDLDSRMKALNALKEHGNLLFKLANSNAPDEAKQAVNSLDDALFKLKASFDEEPQSPSEKEFKEKAGAFAIIAGEITKLTLNAKIDEALSKAIILSENDVLSLITLIRDDMDKFRERQRNIVSQTRLFAIEEYNKEIEQQPEPNPKRLGKAIKRLKQTEDAWENNSLLPDLGFNEMMKAHQKLINYAKKGQKTPEDLSELVAIMDAFAKQAKIIADTVKTIQQ